MYRYACTGWFGSTHGIRNIFVTENENPHDIAQLDAQYHSYSNKCDIEMMQKFQLSITSVETYPTHWLATLSHHPKLHHKN